MAEKNYKELAKQARIDVLGMVHRAQTSHIASNFSVIDIATVLYENLIPEDQVVWSKGWSAAAIYYFNAKYGRGPQEAVDKFPHEPYFGLAETSVPGVLCNGGSVGHGLSIAVGIAYAKKLKVDKGTVYCIMSDGELNEGSVWEAAMFAAHHKLDNLVAIVDRNFVQAMGNTKEILDVNPERTFKGFGWLSTTIDGHDYNSLDFSLTYKQGELPWAIVAETIKGKGVSFMEGLLLYHYKNVDDETYQKALTELQHG